MTELEKIEYTKSFIDKLANGINPLDGSVIPDGDVVNNVRLSRCFFYVSDILRQIIDNGGISPSPVVTEKKSARKKPYFLTAEQAESFEYSDTPITATEILNRIASVGPTEGVKKLPKRNLVKWLVSLELLEIVTVGGEKLKRPTPAGEEMGIILEERQGQYGVYSVILYNKDAQHFIIDNIEAMLSFDNTAYRAKMNLDNQGKAWDAEQDRRLLSLYDEGLTVHEIATAMKRGVSAVKIRLRRHGIDTDSLITALPKEDYREAETALPKEAERAGAEQDSTYSWTERTGAEQDSTYGKAESAGAEQDLSQREATAQRVSCQSCKFARSGDCFPQKNVCSEYEPAYGVPKEEREGWPEMGDASYLRQEGRRR